MKKNTNEIIEKELNTIKTKQKRTRKSKVKDESVLNLNTSSSHADDDKKKKSTTKVKKTKEASLVKKTENLPAKKNKKTTVKKTLSAQKEEPKAKTLSKSKLDEKTIKPILDTLKENNTKKVKENKASVSKTKTSTLQVEKPTTKKVVKQKKEKATTKKENEVVTKLKDLKKLENAKLNTSLSYKETSTQNLEIRREKSVVNPSKIKVLYVASECQPFIATGGLGDVAGSLPKEIVKLGEIDIRVVLPLYKNIKDTYINELKFIGNFTTHLAWRQEYCGIFTLEKNGVIYYFIDNERYFKREKPYGYYDDGERLSFFSRINFFGCSNFR